MIFLDCNWTANGIYMTSKLIVLSYNLL